MANAPNPERSASTAREWQTGQGSAVGAAGAIQEGAGGLAASVAEKARDVWESTKATASSMTATAGDAWDDVAGFMGRYPVATFLAGVGVGALLMAACTSQWTGSAMIRGMEEAGRNPRHCFDR